MEQLLPVAECIVLFSVIQHETVQMMFERLNVLYKSSNSSELGELLAHCLALTSGIAHIGCKIVFIQLGSQTGNVSAPMPIKYGSAASCEGHTQGWNSIVVITLTSCHLHVHV